MARTVEIAPANDRELVLCRLLAAPRAKLWRCWTEADLLRRWFCPAPWHVPHAEIEVRAGGKSFVVMRGPNGEANDHHGLFLEVVPERKLVFTDAFVDAWQPSTRPFMVATITFEDHPEGTLYTARVGHWSVDERINHEAMGFQTGWGIVTEQLEATARTLA